MTASNRQRKAFAASNSHHSRQKATQFIAEGLRCCREAILRRPEWIDTLFLTDAFLQSSEGEPLRAAAQRAGLNAAVISERELAELAGTPNPQGILALLNKPTCPPPAAFEDPFVLLLDRITEPGNLGTILRTAWAIGLTQVWLVKGGADPYAPKVVRAGMGAQFALNLPVFNTLQDAADHFRAIGGKRFWVTLPQADISLYDEQAFQLDHSAIVIGNEANGVSDPAIGIPVTIPMPGHAESLNAAQATTIFLFEAVRRNIMNK